MVSIKVVFARWRSRRSAAVAGIIFAVLLITAMVTIRLALDDAGALNGADPSLIRGDAEQRHLINFGLQLVPFAGIAFLWFIGVLREQVGAVEDLLFSTVFLGSGLLFVAMMFMSAVTTASLANLLAGGDLDQGVWEFGRMTARDLVSVYAMRMAAVFTLSVSTLGIRTGSFPRWVSIVGYAVAAVLLIAAGEHRWAQLVFPSWILLLSLAILAGTRHHPAAAQQPAVD